MRTLPYRRAQAQRRKLEEARKHPCCPTPREVAIYARTRVRTTCLDPTCCGRRRYVREQRKPLHEVIG